MFNVHESKGYELWAPVLGRVLIAALFIMGGIGKIMDFAGSVGYAQAFNVPFPEIAIIIAIIVELGGGLMILFGLWTRFAAFMISAFLIVVTLIFHTNFEDPNQMIQFLKNAAIIGGLLYVSVYGAHKVALKKCPAPKA
ncbi:MAG: DoxX family protein [Patescibacteria group bacterium UBA2103]